MLDYAEEFESLGSTEVFVKMWPQYADTLRKICNEKYECQKHTKWTDDIENILLLIKILPFPQRGVKKRPFKDMIENVIVFRVVSITVVIK